MELKTTDLRLGNLLLHGSDVIKVTGINEAQISFIDRGQERYHRLISYRKIPLTEEILLKMGFEKSNPSGWVTMGEDYFKKGEFVIESRKSLNSFSYEWHKKFKDSNNIGTYFKYVHELQNLYHSLTGSELTIKEPISL
jgi:hypothetical protein